VENVEKAMTAPGDPGPRPDGFSVSADTLVPADLARRPGRRRAVLALALALAFAAAAGAAGWAALIPAPVLRPVGLAAGVTDASVTLR
jgi:ferric-dicitrate binding protein FerR (iron transport regulator)